MKKRTSKTKIHEETNLKNMTNTPKYRQEWIFEELKKCPLLSFGECFRKYSVKFSKSEKTFVSDWKQAQAEIQAYQNKVQKQKERESIKQEVKAVKKGVKTKIERVLLLQKQIEDLLGKLERNTHTQEVFKEGKVLKYERGLTPQEITAYNRTIKELQAEISKMEGDYAVEKISMQIEQPLFGD